MTRMIKEKIKEAGTKNSKILQMVAKHEKSNNNTTTTNNN